MLLFGYSSLFLVLEVLIYLGGNIVLLALFLRKNLRLGGQGRGENLEGIVREKEYDQNMIKFKKCLE